MLSHSSQVEDYQSSISSKIKIDQQACPACGQDIPPDKVEEISGKIALREREQARAVAARLEQQFTAEKVQAAARFENELKAEREANAVREANARTEASKKIIEAEQSRQQLNEEWQKRFDGLEEARKSSEQLIESLQSNLSQVRQETDATIATIKAEAQTAEAHIRLTANQEAQAQVTQKIAALEASRVASEKALTDQIRNAEKAKETAQQEQAELQQQLQHLITENQAEIVRIRAASQKEAAEIAQRAVAEQLSAYKEATNLANAKAAEAETRLNTASEHHATQLNEQLGAQREVLEKAKEDAVNIERAKAFEENQKLSSKVSDLQRALEKKTNEELGEGAEIDLFEALRTDFPDDRIVRIPKGSPGADIKHIVMSRGCECGTILYDSKNHQQFRWDHVQKLKADQLAAKAEHSILSTHKFPQGTAQVHIHDGVVLAKPARVIVLAGIIRQHIMHVHRLRLSAVQRDSKTKALYEFITSERCTQLLGRVESNAEKLLKLQTTEVAWHNQNWKNQGATIRNIQKAKADLEHEISEIISTGSNAVVPRRG